MGAYSKLHNLTYKTIKKHFPHYTIRENIRPDWLVSSNNTKLELDLYIEEINTAIEVQGMQHYQYTPHFHKTYGEFKSQQKRDQEKRDLCYGRGVRLVEIAMSLDLDLFISELKSNSEPDIMQLPLDEQRRIAKQEAKAKKKKKPRPSFAGSKKFKQWLKRKILRKKGLLPPPMIYRKLPGSHRQRNRARHLLKCEQKYQTPPTWRVWGGENNHIVEQIGIDRFECSCDQFHVRKTICSHVIKVMMETGVFPSPTLEQGVTP